MPDVSWNLKTLTPSEQVQHNHGGESEPAGGEAEDGVLAIAFGRFRFRYSRHSWNVVSMDQRRVSHATICCGFIVISVVKKYSSRWVPVQSWTYTQRTSTRASPMRYQCPVPVTTSIARVVPPYQATVRRVAWPCSPRPREGTPVSGLSRAGVRSCGACVGVEARTRRHRHQTC